MTWISSTIAAAALGGLIAVLLVQPASRILVWAAARWPRIGSWDPRVTLLLAGAVPLLLGITVGAGMFWPGMLGHVLHLCHCDTGVVSTGHGSVLHPELSGALLPWAASVLGLLLVPPARVLRSGLRRQRAIREMLPDTPTTDEETGDRILSVPMGIANAVTVGLLRPEILVDRAWWRSLSKEDRRIVCTHEQAHKQHRDPLVLLIARVATAWLPGRRRDVLLSVLALQMETRADRAAARAADDPVAVADLLVRAHRVPTTTPAPTLAFVGAHLERRVQALVAAEPTEEIWRSPVQLGLLAVAVAVWVAMFTVRGVFHSLAEALLALGH